MKLIGIYKITSPSKKIYIGQSVDINRRWRRYKILDCKTQQILYRSFLKYGVEKHKFEIIQLCDKEQLNELEKYYVDLFQTFNSQNGLNIKDGGGATSKHSDETKLKMSKASKGRYHSEETKEKLRILNTGKKLPIEQKHKLRLANLGKVHSEETKSKIKAGNTGKIITDETKLKQSKASKGVIKSIKHRLILAEAKTKVSGRYIINLQTGIFYFSILEISLMLNEKSDRVSAKLNNRQKNNTDFIYC